MACSQRAAHPTISQSHPQYQLVIIRTHGLFRAVLIGWKFIRHVEAQVKNHLKTLRAEYGWTQADLAGKLDVSRQTINAIEKGKFDPSLPLAFKTAKLFKLKIEDIFDDS